MQCLAESFRFAVAAGWDSFFFFFWSGGDLLGLAFCEIKCCGRFICMAVHSAWLPVWDTRFFGSGWKWYVYLIGSGSSKSLNKSMERIDNTEMTPRTSSNENWWTGNNSQTQTQVPPRYAWKSIKRSLHINLDKIEQHPDRSLPTSCMRDVLIHSIPLFISLLRFLQNECQPFFLQEKHLKQIKPLGMVRV